MSGSDANAVAHPSGRRGWRLRTHLLLVLLVLVIIGLVQGWVVKPFRVDSASMEPTLHVGQRLLLDRTAYRRGPIERGDVIMFALDPQWRGAPDPTIHGPLSLARWTVGLVGIGSGLRTVYVKRVIGLPGDTVMCCDDTGAVVVNGHALTEPYLGPDYPFTAGTLDCTTTPRSSRCFDTLTVPAGRLLVMGDHRADSDDSVARCRGGTAVEGCARWALVDRVLGRVIR